MSRKPGDWDCPFCDHLNFSRRDSCQRCAEARPLPERATTRDLDFLGGGGSGSGSSGSGGGGGRSFALGGRGDDVRPGDWYCVDCNAHNFASRRGCYKCGAFRDADAAAQLAGDRRFDSAADRREPPPRRYVSQAFGGGGGAFAAVGSRSVWKSGDWICPRTGCKEHNFANRIECFRCNARREPGIGIESGLNPFQQ